MGADSYGRVLLLTDSQRLAQGVVGELRHAQFDVEHICGEGEFTQSRLLF